MILRQFLKELPSGFKSAGGEARGAKGGGNLFHFPHEAPGLWRHGPAGSRRSRPEPRAVPIPEGVKVLLEPEGLGQRFHAE